jgi:hypothetical protein
MSRANLGQPTAFCASLDECLTRFLGQSVRRTLLIQGAWGTGKTYAVRQFLNGNRKLAPTFSYVSLSGVHEIGDERTLALSGLERAEGKRVDVGVLKAFRAAVAKGIDKVPVLGALGPLSDLGAQLSATALLKDAVVVLDDLERAESKLLPSIFGAISRLVELRGARVWAVMNEDELQANKDSADELARQREKLFDEEFEFAPTPENCLQLVAPGAGAHAVRRVVSALSIRNVRIVRKVDWITESVHERLEEVGFVDRDVRERVLNQAAALEAIRLRGNTPLKGSHLKSAFSFEMVEAIGRRRERPDKADPEYLDNPFREDLTRLDFEPSAVDECLLRFIETGTLDDQAFREALKQCEGAERANDYHQTAEKVWSAYRTRFGPLTPDQLQALGRLTAEFLNHMDPHELPLYARLLNAVGRRCDLGELERRWARGAPVSPREDFGASVWRQLTDPEAQKVLSKRFDEARNRDRPEPFTEMLAEGKPTGRWLAQPESTDAGAIAAKLSSMQEPRLVRQLENLAEAFSNMPLETPQRVALLEALERLADADPLNAMRLESHLKALRESHTDHQGENPGDG